MQMEAEIRGEKRLRCWFQDGGRGPRAKEGGWPLEAGKDKE